VLQHVGDWTALRRHWRERLRVLTGAYKHPSGKDCILSYLKLMVGEDVANSELMVVSGIAEYARRIRELRVEYGYEIGTSGPESDVPAGHYRLYSVEPSVARANVWQAASRIRRSSGPDKGRILKLLQGNVKVPLTHDMLQYVGKGKSTRERLRDLRLSDGWRIATRRTGRPDLRNDEYMLVSLEQLPPHDRAIPAETYEAVLERDGRRCRKCNWRPAARVYGGRRHSLEVHHKVSFARGGAHRIGNLITLCDMDHDIVHRKGIEGPDAVRAWVSKKPAYYVKS